MGIREMFARWRRYRRIWKLYGVKPTWRTRWNILRGKKTNEQLQIEFYDRMWGNQDEDTQD